MEEGKKKNKGLIVLVVILILIILGLVGYIMYGTNVVYKHFKAEESTTQKEEETVISDEIINSLLDIVPEAEYPILKENSEINEVDHYVVVPYDNDHNTVDTMDETILNGRSFDSASKKYGTVDSADKSEIQPATCITRENFDKELKRNYNKTTDRYYDYKAITDGSGAEISITENFVCVVNNSGGIISYVTLSKTDKAEYNKKDIDIYVSVLFIDTRFGTNGENIAVFNDYNYSNKLEEISNVSDNTAEENTLLENKILQDHYKEAAKYKHTFKLNDDGSYYWYSTEKVGD